MADLSKIKVGDKLKVELEVCELDLDHVVYPIRCKANFAPGDDETFSTPWVYRELVEAAEHIPAPRVFKRGDWVRWKGDHTKQMVIADKGESLWVTSDDHAKNIIWRKQDCEPTEAPE